jgi:hypothetical protein
VGKSVDEEGHDVACQGKEVSEATVTWFLPRLENILCSGFDIVVTLIVSVIVIVSVRGRSMKQA